MQTMKGIAHDQRDAVMILVGNVKMSKQEFDAIACRFLGSDFTGQIYGDWPIDLSLARPQRDGRTIEFVAESCEMQPNG
jgi:hypothetical protein